MVMLRKQVIAEIKYNIVKKNKQIKSISCELNNWKIYVHISYGKIKTNHQFFYTKTWNISFTQICLIKRVLYFMIPFLHYWLTMKVCTTFSDFIKWLIYNNLTSRTNLYFPICVCVAYFRCKLLKRFRQDFRFIRYVGESSTLLKIISPATLFKFN